MKRGDSRCRTQRMRVKATRTFKCARNVAVAAAEAAGGHARKRTRTSYAVARARPSTVRSYRRHQQRQNRTWAQVCTPRLINHEPRSENGMQRQRRLLRCLGWASQRSCHRKRPQGAPHATHAGKRQNKARKPVERTVQMSTSGLLKRTAKRVNQLLQNTSEQRGRVGNMPPGGVITGTEHPVVGGVQAAGGLSSSGG